MSLFSVRAQGSAPRAIDEAEVRRALAVLADPAAGCELRGLPSGRSFTARGDDPDSLVLGVRQLADDAGVYYCLNPIPPSLGRAARVQDVLARRWLLVDVDPCKPEEAKDRSATEAEHEAARAVASAVVAHLDGLGWPSPVLVDSGNGWHLLYRVELPANDHARVLIGNVLRALARRFDGPGATIDRKVHNASRIAKLPGTWARKGPESPDRPHRMCRLVHTPDPLAVVPVDRLVAAGGMGDEGASAGTPTPQSIWTVRAAGEGGTGYGRAALEREVARVLLAAPGTRNDTLNRSAFNLGQLVGGGVLDRADVEQALGVAAHQVGLTEGEIAATVRSGIEAGLAEPRGVPERPPPGSARAGGRERADANQGAAQPDEPITVQADTIKPQVVRWLWPGRIPLGKLTTFAGWGGLGKSFVTADLAARVSQGNEVPGPARGECFEKAGVLILNTEDDPSDTTVPRLIESGADLSRIRFLTPAKLGAFTLADIEVLRRAFDEMGDCRLVIIDPASAHLGYADDHKNAQLRGLLAPLGLFAAETGVAILMVTHVSKPGAGKTEAAARVIGGVAWVNAVRSAMMFVKDPDDDAHRLMVPIKSNLAAMPKALGYRIVKTTTLAEVKWDEKEVDTTAEDAMSAERKPENRPRAVNAADWLREQFTGRTEIPSAEIFAKARAVQISVNALKEAKAALRIKAVQRRDAENGSAWFWLLLPSMSVPIPDHLRVARPDDDEQSF